MCWVLLVTNPSEGPCGINNGGCDQICNADSGIARCFCKVGYFSIAFLPTKCFGNNTDAQIYTPATCI